ncbi:hypothetical protein ACJMK2_036810 [Sinanodonta woodiana]|uniref:OLD protein-like TOPRIM domain-containing protein n=1 Tax=Sinanodonta woodiana TaxID=1069815 RepID=A0ABD3WJQ6_SINWO
MLRAVRLNNFVKFRNDCMFSFREGGAYFFVGENGSEKSSVLEGIRRCLSRDANTSFSGFPDESKPSYIICEYEMPDGCLLSDCKKVFTSFLYIPDTTSTYKYAKNVLLVKKDEVFIEFIERENDAYLMKHRTCSFQDEEEQNIRKEIFKYLPLCTKDSDSSDNNITTLLAFLKKLLYAKREDTVASETADKHSEVENVLSSLENSLVFTFGQRSLGPLLWSKSKLIAIPKRDKNYRTARGKCEIINYFLSNSNSYDTQKEDKIFRLLTNQANYVFYLKKDGLVSVKLDGDGVEVLKLSEGILEAKYLSLLLACKEHFTILLQEPDRGMHPQMIKLIRDIVLPEVKDKTTIIVFHNPIIISSWCIPRTYKFYKIRDGDKLISKMYKIPRLLASEDYVCILFARNVIFVEGQSDFFFVKAIIEHIMTQPNDKSTQRVLNLALSGETKNTQQFLTFLASLHVVKLSGEKNKHKWKYVSRELGLSGWFLLDRDAVVQVQTVDTCNLAADTIAWTKNSKETSLSTFMFQPKMEDGLVSQDLKSRYVDFVKKNKWLEARQCLEEEGVFVWRSGNLEDVFIDIVKNFEWADETTKIWSSNQTLLDDNVSDENIRESIVSAFNLCDKDSDITQFILFLERTQRVGLGSNIQK